MHCKVLLHYIFDYDARKICDVTVARQTQVYQLNTQLSTMPVLLASLHKNCIIISVGVIVYNTVCN